MQVTISTNRDDLDFDVIYGFISTSYWATGIPREVMQKAIDNSLCFGAYNTAGEQIAFARVTTDKATFAYLADVFVLESYRGLGVSTKLMEAITGHPDLQGLRRFMLATFDAHGLYAKFGFKPIEHVDTLMQVHSPDVYNQRGY
ncbi:GNAT family N-acetyltransferase [Alteromonas sp. ASW11-36]|uniref:GNAT family N-acetyltransferase n=1 Tax=Alteromonas arenosi TaxID=3055817 RepID=A0ABT7T268_9ALTE|nr:GNAT family N-acetyltransferase [Alteromonas sp. ASW11-36]MDM7862324.1 GNAT family N-acetyltransferase [Alteromonas sp. ASW11-36]